MLRGKVQSKDPIVDDSIFITFQSGQIIETEDRSAVCKCWGWRGGEGGDVQKGREGSGEGPG